ncbi:hypothetical protein L7F22_048631 [Adiantum nelumboides]|nr:hypothetical protein [Adiantum nelumboides]
MIEVCVIMLVVVIQVVRGDLPAKPPPPQLGNFTEDFEPTWGATKQSISEGGRQLQLSLDCSSGSGVKSKKSYLFANLDMQMKLVQGDSAGTVTSYYLSSPVPDKDKLEYELLGNEIGRPYTVQTNVFVNGVGGREQRIHLWFDPTTDFHIYTIFWTPQLVVFLIDRTPIRVFKKINGQPYLDKQSMQVYSSISNGGNWATKDGIAKTNRTHLPFIAGFRNFEVKPAPIPPPINYTLLSCVKKNYMVYDYCLDRARYPSVPIDCL